MLLSLIACLLITFVFSNCFQNVFQHFLWPCFLKLFSRMRHMLNYRLFLLLAIQILIGWWWESQCSKWTYYTIQGQEDSINIHSSSTKMDRLGSTIISRIRSWYDWRRTIEYLHGWSWKTLKCQQQGLNVHEWSPIDFKFVSLATQTYQRLLEDYYIFSFSFCNGQMVKLTPSFVEIKGDRDWIPTTNVHKRLLPGDFK